MEQHAPRILLLYTDPYYIVKQVYPFGLDVIARYLRERGFHVDIDVPFLPDADVAVNLTDILHRTDPDVVGLGIRNIDTTMACEAFGNFKADAFRTFFFVPEIKKIAEILKRIRPELPIVAGGGAFSVAPEAFLDALKLDYGIVGEGETPLYRFVMTFPDPKAIAQIPGMVYRDGSQVVVNPKKPYRFVEPAAVFARDSGFAYAFETAGLPVQVKRGCNRGCMYCVEPVIEGKKPIHRPLDTVVEELEFTARHQEGVKKIFFVDTEFNVPDLAYASALVKRILDGRLNERFTFASQFLPRPFDSSFSDLLAKAGFSIILTADSFSSRILERCRAPFHRQDIGRALDLCRDCGIDCTVNLIFGLPGETHETVEETLGEMARRPPAPGRRYEYTIGARIYPGTPLQRFVKDLPERRHVFGSCSKDLLAPCFYCSPEPPLALKAYIDERLPAPIQFHNRCDSSMRQGLAAVYLADHGRWDEALQAYCHADLAAQARIFDYLFRKLAGEKRVSQARHVASTMIDAAARAGDPCRCADQASVARYYLQLLGAGH
ncbi:MAG: B12-binding domain-containing radical SAM protein [Desulfobacterales bacterium]|nr:B12-binding domain-containing radical SAM protein [Desulfobacterales bacterium]